MLEGKLGLLEGEWQDNNKKKKLRAGLRFFFNSE